MEKLKPHHTDDRRCTKDLRRKFVGHPRLQSKKKISAADAAGSISLGFLRGRHAGVFDSYKTLRKAFPKAAQALLDAYGMNKKGEILLN